MENRSCCQWRIEAAVNGGSKLLSMWPETTLNEQRRIGKRRVA
jgi:hypothetical protein